MMRRSATKTSQRGRPSPSRRRFLLLAAGAGGAASLGLWRTLWHEAPGEPVERTARALGAAVSIKAVHPKRSVAERAVTAALAELAEIEDILSLYRPASQLRSLNRDGRLRRPHAHVVSLLRQAERLSRQSGGAFDATVQPLWDTYAEATRAGSLPDTAAVAAAQARVNWRKVEVGSYGIRLAVPGMGVTLNGLAQGFATDRVLATLKEAGVDRALVNVGEIASLGRRPDGGAWTAGVQHPRRPDAYVWVARLDGRAMATSGDYATAFSPDYTHHHIFDPRVGRSPQAFASVTVLARTGLEADGLSTAVFVMGPKTGLPLIEATPGADALMVFKDGSARATRGFPRDVSKELGDAVS